MARNLIHRPNFPISDQSFFPLSYELERGNYGKAYGNDSMCVSQSPYEDLYFDIQDHCHGGSSSMKVGDSRHERMARGGHGLPKVLLGPAMLDPPTPCRRATAEMAVSGVARP
jgi:hypothetical protein